MLNVYHLQASIINICYFIIYKIAVGLFSRLLKRQLINQNCNTENSREQIKSTKLTIPQILTDHFTYIAFTSPQLNDQVLVLVFHIPQKQTQFYKSYTHYEEGGKVNMAKSCLFFYF